MNVNVDVEDKFIITEVHGAQFIQINCPWSHSSLPGKTQPVEIHGTTDDRRVTTQLIQRPIETLITPK